MRIFSVRQAIVVFAVLLVIGIGFVDAGAQRRRKRPRRPTTVTPAPSPTPTSEMTTNPGDPHIISTADQVNSTTPRATRAKPAPTPVPESDQEQLRRTISDLSGQLNQLTNKLNRMEEQQRSLVDLERLSRAEQRSETFRAQLRDVLAKEVELQAQLDQVDFALQPEQIERSVATFGTTHPETAREQRKRGLESQKARLQAQYTQLEQSRMRLETAVTTADAEIEKLQKQMEMNSQPTVAVPAEAPTPAEDRPPQSR